MSNNLSSLFNCLYTDFYIKFFPNYFNFLKKNLFDCTSVLELGCGNNSPLQYFSKKFYSCGVDIFLPYLKESEGRHIHKSYIFADILNLGIRPKSFDCVLALDVLEHLDKEEGLKLITLMKSVARKKVIIFTPNGFLKQDPYDNNIYHMHKSGWVCEDLKKLGFSPFGFFGLKCLRAEQAKLKYRPRFLWFIISELSQLLVFRIPQSAAQILYIKTL